MKEIELMSTGINLHHLESTSRTPNKYVFYPLFKYLFNVYNKDTQATSIRKSYSSIFILDFEKVLLYLAPRQSSMMGLFLQKVPSSMFDRVFNPLTTNIPLI